MRNRTERSNPAANRELPEVVPSPGPPALFDLRPAKKSEIDPGSVVATISKDYRAEEKRMRQAVRSAHNSESDTELKQVRALDTLINETFRFASQGPEFLLPAIVMFLKVGEKEIDLLGVESPTVEQALIDRDLHGIRREIINAPMLLHSAPSDLIIGSVSRSAQYYSEERRSGQHVSTEFGVPLIDLGLYQRLPSHSEQVENSILTASFLTLMEETIHAVQELRCSKYDDNELLLNGDEAPIEDLLCSKLAALYFKEAGIDLSSELQRGVLTLEHLEIDVLGRLVELAEEHCFPLDCLAPELRKYHFETRKDFVTWLESRMNLLSTGGSCDFSFHGPGKAERVVMPLVSLREEANDLLELLKDALLESPDVRLYRGLGLGVEKILGDAAGFEFLKKQAETASPELMKKVLGNVKAGRDAKVIPQAWHTFAVEECDTHKSPLSAIVVQEYLYRVGFLRPRTPEK